MKKSNKFVGALTTVFLVLSYSFFSFDSKSDIPNNKAIKLNTNKKIINKRKDKRKLFFNGKEDKI